MTLFLVVVYFISSIGILLESCIHIHTHTLLNIYIICIYTYNIYILYVFTYLGK